MEERKDFISRVTGKNILLMTEAERWLWKHPQTGYNEWEAHNYLKQKIIELGYDVTEAGNIPGFFSDIDTGRPGPVLCIMAELDALDIENHKESVNGMCHCCGHHTQGASLLGVAAALREKGMLDNMWGKIRLMFVPAEELIQISFRENLREKGIIHFFGGKPEFMYRGFFDGVDISLMVHAATTADNIDFTANSGNVGFVAKTFKFKGKSSHAAGGPDVGINAEYAAMLALNACNALRETFRDEDCVRFHPILHGINSAVNIIPDEVSGETYVRATEIDTIKRENKKINRAFAGAALSLGARVEIHDRPGYMPECHQPALMKLTEECCCMISGKEKVIYEYGGRDKGSSDFGDVTSVMPGMQIFVGGARGNAHGIDYKIEDPERLCGNSAKVLLLIADTLLSDKAEKAHKIIADYVPRFKTIKDYVAYMDEFISDTEAVIYAEDGSAEVNF